MWPILQLSTEIVQLWIFYYLIFLFLAMSETDFACHVAGNTHAQSYSGPHFSRIFRIGTEYGEILQIRTPFKQWKLAPHVGFSCSQTYKNDAF